ncbi:MAG: hypothetical protein NTW28_08740 [Candidatus Solibacter sp.]|nr:hypothetical protein [Candidatus Solibacter sp.]
MNFVRKSVLPVMGVAAIALLITIASPRAVHAIVAAMVQVVNTPTNAVPTMQAPAASQRYRSWCQKKFNYDLGGFCYLDPVPAGQTLFVEAISIKTEAGNDLSTGRFYSGNELGGGFAVPMFQQGSSNTFVGTFAGRISVSASQQPSCLAMFATAQPSGNMECLVYGYLAPAQ